MKVYNQASLSDVFNKFSQAKRVGVSRVLSSVTEAVFIQVGGGRVSLSRWCCLEFYFVETTFILEYIFFLFFGQPCVQFSLQPTHPQEHSNS